MLDGRLMIILRWLSAPDPAQNHQRAFEQRLEKTGLWFLESEQYTAWKTDAASFLWLYGMPGCGKTILSSTIIQSILQDCRNDPTKVIAYYYFDFNDPQKRVAERMVKSLIVQLSQYCIEPPTALYSFFSSRLRWRRQLDSLLQVLRQMIQNFPASFIVLDALDECNDRGELLHILDTITSWQLEDLHILVASRNEADIRVSMEGLVRGHNTVCLQSEVVDKDICSYVLHRLSNDHGLQRWRGNPEVQQEIETVLMGKACGMCVEPLIPYVLQV